MKYNILLSFLRVLVLTKRFFWWAGGKVFSLFSVVSSPVWRTAGYLQYKAGYFLRKIGIGSIGEKTLRRGNLQVLFFLILGVLSVTETRFWVSKADAMPGQKTIVYNLSVSNEISGTEEIVADIESVQSVGAPSWRQGAVEASEAGAAGFGWREQEIGGVFAGGMALSKPIILPGASIGISRNKVMEYTVEPGDSLGSIAYQFGISVSTILWENNLTLRSLIKPGQKLRIPPTDGVVHTVKKGDNLGKIAKLYGVKSEEIAEFNKIKADGSDLKIGDEIVIPGGVRKSVAVSSPARGTTVAYRAAPPSSVQAPGASGFVWPSRARTITQYYGIVHRALDIAGAPKGSPNYAAKAGTVLISQCGWNNGYGCYIVIDHGGGVRTLYGHNSKLLVAAGDYVETGQTIALIGNTGKVRGVTGVHLHFEIIINGGRVNPLGYVR